MKVIENLLLLFVFGIFILSKVFFYFNEGVLYDNILITIDVFLTIVLFSIILFAVFKQKLTTVYYSKTSLFTLVCLVSGFLLICFSGFINIKKNVIGYDSVALYDARAKFMEYGLRFRDMTVLMKYNTNQKYYYGSYPPFTSLMHYFWYEGTNHKLPVGLVYTIFLTVLFISCYVFALSIGLNTSFASLFSVLVIMFPSIFRLSILEYTNLPFALVLFLSVFYFWRYLKLRNSLDIYISILFLSYSQWIRFIEPLWLILLLVYISTLLFLKIKINKFVLSGFTLFCVISFLSWKMYSSKFLGVDVIFQTDISNLVRGLFDLNFFKFTFSVLWMWKYYLIFYTCVYVFSNKVEAFYRNTYFAITILILGFYFISLYYLYYATWEWKNIANDSVIRATVFLIPISFYVAIKDLSERLKCFTGLIATNKKVK